MEFILLLKFKKFRVFQIILLTLILVISGCGQLTQNKPQKTIDYSKLTFSSSTTSNSIPRVECNFNDQNCFSNQAENCTKAIGNLPIEPIVSEGVIFTPNIYFSINGVNKERCHLKVVFQGASVFFNVYKEREFRKQGLTKEQIDQKLIQVDKEMNERVGEELSCEANNPDSTKAFLDFLSTNITYCSQDKCTYDFGVICSRSMKKLVPTNSLN